MRKGRKSLYRYVGLFIGFTSTTQSLICLVFYATLWLCYFRNCGMNSNDETFWHCLYLLFYFSGKETFPHFLTPSIFNGIMLICTILALILTVISMKMMFAFYSWKHIVKIKRWDFIWRRTILVYCLIDIILSILFVFDATSVLKSEKYFCKTEDTKDLKKKYFSYGLDLLENLKWDLDDSRVENISIKKHGIRILLKNKFNLTTPGLKNFGTTIDSIKTENSDILQNNAMKRNYTNLKSLINSRMKPHFQIQQEFNRKQIMNTDYPKYEEKRTTAITLGLSKKSEKFLKIMKEINRLKSTRKSKSIRPGGLVNIKNEKPIDIKITTMYRSSKDITKDVITAIKDIAHLTENGEQVTIIPTKNYPGKPTMDFVYRIYTTEIFKKIDNIGKFTSRNTSVTSYKNKSDLLLLMASKFGLNKQEIDIIKNYKLNAQTTPNYATLKKVDGYYIKESTKSNLSVYEHNVNRPESTTKIYAKNRQKRGIYYETTEPGEVDHYHNLNSRVYLAKDRVEQLIHICENDYVRIECMGYDIINVLECFYGREHGPYCYKSSKDDDVNCRTNHTDDCIQMCKSLSTCVIYVSDFIFSNACPALVTKYLTLRFVCKHAYDYPFIESTCELDRTINLECRGNKLIKLIHAFYGSFGKEWCPPKPDSVQRDCLLPTALQHISKACNNRRMCYFEPLDLFPDPCNETRKKLNLKYICVYREPNTVLIRTICLQCTRWILTPHILCTTVAIRSGIIWILNIVEAVCLIYVEKVARTTPALLFSQEFG